MRWVRSKKRGKRILWNGYGGENYKGDSYNSAPRCEHMEQESRTPADDLKLPRFTLHRHAPILLRTGSLSLRMDQPRMGRRPPQTLKGRRKHSRPLHRIPV